MNFLKKYAIADILDYYVSYISLNVTFDAPLFTDYSIWDIYWSESGRNQYYFPAAPTVKAVKITVYDPNHNRTQPNNFGGEVPDDNTHDVDVYLHLDQAAVSLVIYKYMSDNNYADPYEFQPFGIVGGLFSWPYISYITWWASRGEAWCSNSITSAPATGAPLTLRQLINDVQSYGNPMQYAMANGLPINSYMINSNYNGSATHWEWNGCSDYATITQSDYSGTYIMYGTDSTIYYGYGDYTTSLGYGIGISNTTPATPIINKYLDSKSLYPRLLTGSVGTASPAPSSQTMGSVDMEVDLSNVTTSVAFNLFKKTTTSFQQVSIVALNITAYDVTANTLTILLAGNISNLRAGTTITIDSAISAQTISIFGASITNYAGTYVIQSIDLSTGSTVIGFPPVAGFIPTPLNYVYLYGSYIDTNTVVIQDTYTLYPRSIYLSSITIVNGPQGNGYSSVSILNAPTDTIYNNVVYSVNTEGAPTTAQSNYRITINASIANATHPNMALSFNFIDSAGNTFSYVCSDPLVEIDVGNLNSKVDLAIQVPTVLDTSGAPIVDYYGNATSAGSNSFLSNLVYVGLGGVVGHSASIGGRG